MHFILMLLILMEHSEPEHKISLYQINNLTNLIKIKLIHSHKNSPMPGHLYTLMHKFPASNILLHLVLKFRSWLKKKSKFSILLYNG
jgi:hypothetical protein